jgi:hypothetical protein
MTANERPEPGDRFGAALDGFDAYLVVGAPGESFGGAARRGVAHLFDGHRLSEVQRLEFPGGRAGDGAGAAVAISDTHVVVGVPGHDRGGVRDVGAVGLWPIADGPVTVEIARQPWAPPRGLSFGASVTRVLFRSGWTFAVGAPGDTIRGVSTAGSVRFVGPRAPDGWIDRTASVIPGNPGRGDRFGSVLGFGIRGQLVVGAPGAGPGGSGAVFVAAADPDWIVVHQDVPGIGGRASDRHGFGDAVAG